MDERHRDEKAKGTPCTIMVSDWENKQKQAF